MGLQSVSQIGTGLSSGELKRRYSRRILQAAAVGVAVIFCGLAQAQTTATAPAALGAVPEAPPSAAVQPFVGSISSDRVYVRAGPGKNYYEVGQLNRGDLVNVIAEHSGWYQISPPAGTFCYIAKEFVEADANGKTGAAKVDYVNVRGASAIHPGSEYAVLTTIRKGTPLAIVGSTDKYYEIASPEKAYMYVTAEFVTPAEAGTAYKAATIKLPAGVVGPVVPATPVGMRLTGEVAATEAATTRESASVIHAPASSATEPVAVVGPVAASEVATAATQEAPAVEHGNAPQPTTQYAEDVYTRFNNLNGITQTEFQKPLMQRDLAGLLKDWQDLGGEANVPPSVKLSSESRVDMIQKYLTLQNLAKGADTKSDPVFQEKQKAYEEQWKAVETQLTEAELNGPCLAQGRLETSKAVASKYVLVNPATGRVVAYLDPTSDIDLAKLLGEYVGVRGSVSEDDAVRLKVIKVRSATVMAVPSTQPAR